MEDNIRYGFLNSNNDKVKIKMKKGQNIAGYSIGIIYIEDVYYPILPGNVVNACTYDFPVRMMPVKHLTADKLFACEENVYDAIYEACMQLQKEGVRAISGACGFFGNYQKSMAEKMDVPVALSSLVQLPWIAALLKPGQKIAVLTADESSVTDRLLNNCGISEELRKRLIFKDLKVSKEFSCVVGNWGEWDNEIAGKEVVNRAIEAVKECSDLGAVLLECSDMPPYASAVQEATGLPVFDFITLIKWLHSAVTQRPYCGFI